MYRKKRFLVIGSLPPPFHGSNIMFKYFLDTINSLSYNYLIINRKFSYSQKEIGKFTFKKLYSGIKAMIELISIIIFKKPSFVIILPSVAKLALLWDIFAMYMLRLFSIPYIPYFHGKGYQNIIKKSKFWKYLLQNVFGKSLYGIVLGERLKNDFDGLIKKSKLIKLPNMIPWENFSFKNKKRSIINILYLSNIQREKGLMELIKSACNVTKHNKNFHIYVAGNFREGNFEKEIKEFIRLNHLESYISFLGAVYGEKKQELFCDADIFVFPSYYNNETFGLVNIEAMRAGLPVISSNEGAIPEIIEHNVNGFIIDPHNIQDLSKYMLKLINNEKLRNSMGYIGRKKFEKYYSPDAYAKNVNNLLKKLTKVIEN